jgi:hypothetical protein
MAHRLASQVIGTTGTDPPGGDSLHVPVGGAFRCAGERVRSEGRRRRAAGPLILLLLAAGAVYLVLGDREEAILLLLSTTQAFAQAFTLRSRP